ncbi:endonuclease/exonuclease/phosphatase family protein [Jiangella asiatica]|uniref:Endonuclease/exonuclease/phosphatase family protein n=1 Tax=Jiangella asiatica TaxID=2530372 RepID=A0A4R5DB94_9ACTN|nr:endonuclease/exonuclease/phosphatase family protein [Jiangella asiatica]TDE08784.1 endonuclease/exonuclease/phosphatase family protein [Jiangella asiatica]
MSRPASLALTTSLSALAAVVVVWPQALGLAGHYGPAQVVAMRGLGIAAGMALLILLVAALVAARASRWAGARAHLAVVAVVVAAATAWSSGVVLWRGLDGWRPGAAPAAPADCDLRVLAFNTLHDGVPAAELAALVTSTGADVVVLPETSSATTDEVALLAGGGFQVFHHQVDAGITSATGLLVADTVGRYGPPEPDPGSGLATFTVHPTTPGAPPITAVHAYPPTRSTMDAWRADTAAAVRRCREQAGAVVAGDFNATPDHPALRSTEPCVDAATQAGAGAVGTWPADWPTWAGAPIDHILADSRTWEVTGFSVLAAVGDSDHRPVLAVLRRGS